MNARPVRLLGALAGAALGVAVWAVPAGAEAPAKTGWWNAAAAGGLVLPQPTTGGDDLHVGQGPGRPSALAAVSYPLPTTDLAGATLTLTVVPRSAVGTVDVLACPTRDDSWKAGGNQPISAAPPYDCARGLAGIRSGDGGSVTFLLDAGQQLAGGGFSLAIVPASDARPFSVDFAKPDAASLQVEEAPAPPEDPSAAGGAAPPPFVPPPGDLAGGTGGFGAVTGPDTGAFVPPPAPGPVPEPAPAPAAAPPAAPPGFAAPPTRPAVPVSQRDRYQAGTLLALLTGAFVYACQQPSRERRRLGGLARTAGQAPPPVDPRPRGIGRFAAVRTTAARPLL